MTPHVFIASALSAALERMLWDDQLIEGMSAAIRRDRARFRWSEVAARVLESAETIRSAGS
jgi:glycosyltransferase involved in cell wall biosynthesis